MTRPPVKSIEEIIEDLWGFGAIEIGDTRDTRYNRLHRDAPPSPLKINIRTIANGGRLEDKFVVDIGRHLEDTVTKLNPEIRPKIETIFGVPTAGELLMTGFRQQSYADLFTLRLRKVEVGGKTAFRTDGLEPPQRATVAWGVDDVINSSITKFLAAQAIREGFGLVVQGFSVLICRNPNAEEALRRNGMQLVSSADVASMFAILIDAGKISLDQAEEVMAKLEAYNQYILQHP